MSQYDLIPNKLGLREHRGAESKPSNPLPSLHGLSLLRESGERQQIEEACGTGK